MIIQNAIDGAFDKVHQPFIIKYWKKLKLEITYLNIIKATFQKPVSNFILNGKSQTAFLITSGNRQKYLLSISLQNYLKWLYNQKHCIRQTLWLRHGHSALGDWARCSLWIWEKSRLQSKIPSEIKQLATDLVQFLWKYFT